MEGISVPHRKSKYNKSLSSEEIKARNSDILKQSNETTNPWTKLANKFK